MNETDPLIAYLATHDAPCPGCGYNLRGLRGDSCPECGEHLDVYELRRQKNLEAWIFGYVLYILNIVPALLVLLVCSFASMRFFSGKYPTQSNPYTNYDYLETVVPSACTFSLVPMLLILYVLVTKTRERLVSHRWMWLILNPIMISIGVGCLYMGMEFLAAAIIWY